MLGKGTCLVAVIEFLHASLQMLLTRLVALTVLSYCRDTVRVSSHGHYPIQLLNDWPSRPR